MKKNPVTELRNAVKKIVGNDAFYAIGKMTDKQFRKWEDSQVVIAEPVSYEKRWCNKEGTVRTHAIDKRTTEVMCLNCGDLR